MASFKTHYFLLGFSFMVSTISVKACVHKVEAAVPEELKAGYIISAVNLQHCLNTTLLELTTSDPDFAIQQDGLLYAVHSTRIRSGERAFLIWLQDQQSLQKWKIDVTLSVEHNKVKREVTLRRSKRRWRPLPFSIRENELTPFPKEIQQIQSDSSQKYNIIYKIYGQGVDLPPIGLFSVVPETGMLKVHKAVDREQIAEYKFFAEAKTSDGIKRDQDLDITIKVEDENDNRPEFPDGVITLSVPEHSEIGAIVGQVNATDRDEPGSLFTQIAYRIISNTDLFSIQSETGVIFTASTVLDRETKDTYELTIEAKDCKGQHYGLSNTGTVRIVLTDINDNPPTFKAKKYEAKVEENKKDVLILRIPVDDKDLVNTSNWKAKFVIKKGNENGNFRIETDPVTNEGLLYVIKPFDYEKNTTVKLEVAAENEAKLVGTKSTWATIPVDVSVVNVDEGPEFETPNYFIRFKENEPNGTLIGTYKAFDPETKSSVGIKYYKISDPASWVQIEETTGKLLVANNMDRESSFVTNGMYNITVIAVDQSSKTGTGTVMIYLEDENDNNPVITNKDLVICEQYGRLGYVKVEAQDKDAEPLSSPFVFGFPKDRDRNWKITNEKATSIHLEQATELPTGTYNVPVIIRDQQGKGEQQIVTIRICKCISGQCVASQTSTALGVWGIVALLLAIALLLLLCILLTCFCGKKKEKLDIDNGAEAVLIKSNTEGPGEEVMAPNFKMSAQQAAHQQETQFLEQSGSGLQDIRLSDFQNVNNIYGSETLGDGMQNDPSSFLSATNSTFQTNYGQQFGGGFQHYADQNITSIWRTNGLMIDQKLNGFVTEHKDRFAEDIRHVYGFEGRGSFGGSVGCCSDLNDDNGIEFLNTLGPKFRTLAQICTNK
ncbi:desmocollin-3-like [Polyodon spathula]|uniref:desmocollin-3-like n=1 Tax=Polyodon spathula TaxID=7913 RepID=UPI001B7DD083|nr:desmocollin-3-like [Polyodon spathula]